MVYYLFQDFTQIIIKSVVLIILYLLSQLIESYCMVQIQLNINIWILSTILNKFLNVNISINRFSTTFFL